MSQVFQLPLKDVKKKTWEDVYEGREPNKRIIPYLKLRSDNGVLYVRKYKSGKGELHKSTGYTLKNLMKAKSIAEQMIADWINGKSTSRQRQIDEICDELQAVLEQEFRNKDRKPKTWEQDRVYLPIIKKYFGTQFVSSIDEDFWNDWIRNTGRTLRRNLSDIAKYLSKVLTFAYQKKYINRKPTIRNPDKPKKTGMIYENEDIELFFKHADPFLRDLIIVGAECGLRPHENRGLKWDWITFEKECVIIHIPDDNEKREKGRFLEASENASSCLRRRFQSRLSPFVFPAPKSHLKPVSTKHGCILWQRMLASVNKERIKQGKEPLPIGKKNGLKFHWLRHSFFTKALLDAKLPLAEVAQYGGNSPAILMKRYLQDDPKRTRSVSKVVKLNLGDIGNDSDKIRTEDK